MKLFKRLDLHGPADWHNRPPRYVLSLGRQVCRPRSERLFYTAVVWRVQGRTPIGDYRSETALGADAYYGNPMGRFEYVSEKVGWDGKAARPSEE